MTRIFLTMCCLCLLGLACRSPQPQEAHGRGLVSYDREPPSGSETFPRPAWKVGDRLVFQKGNKLRLGFHVEAREDGGLNLVDDESGTALKLDADLGELGQESQVAPEFNVTYDPVDVRFSWPLWVGKRWICHFVRRDAQGSAVPLLVDYQCDALETVTTPAGTHRALRIWRTARVASSGNYIDRVAILWYAPDLGCVVKRIDDGIVTELVDSHRQ